MLFSGSENPVPALWLACITALTGLALIGVSLLVAVTATLLSWLDVIGRDNRTASPDACSTAPHSRCQALMPGQYGELQ